MAGPTGASDPEPLPREQLELALQLADSRHRDALPRHRVARWLRAALAAPAVITVRVVDAEEGRTLNHAFRGKDYSTNVLTFAYAQEPLVVADIVLCAPVVEREAAERGRPLEAHYAHLIVHGALHARGLEHERDAAARRMEALESRIVGRLGFADPHAS